MGKKYVDHQPNDDRGMLVAGRGRSLAPAACSAGAEPRLCIACMHILMHRYACIPVQEHVYCMHACTDAQVALHMGPPAVLSGCWLAEAAASSSVRACSLQPAAPLQLQVCTQAWRSASPSACGERSSSSSTRRVRDKSFPSSHQRPGPPAQRRECMARPWQPNDAFFHHGPRARARWGQDATGLAFWAPVRLSAARL